MEATGWASGLKKKGHIAEEMERVRQLGLGAPGAKGSDSVYRIAPAAAEEG